MLIALALLVLAAGDAEFGEPAVVTIRGYSGDAMEPFLTRDGRYLLFNNSNERPAETDLHWAERIDELTFDYRGTLAGANSPALDAVPSVDAAGNMYFVSTRSYAQTLATIYRATFDNGTVRDAALLSGVSRGVPGQINFDVEVSADGSTLYFVDGLFTGGAVPASADLVIAVRGPDGQFRREQTDVLAAVNTGALEYAAAISGDQLELFLTRLEGSEPAIYRSTRPTPSARWSTPRRLTAIPGFAEGPTIAPGGGILYYHARREGRFVIERVTRQPPRRRRAVARD